MKACASVWRVFAYMARVSRMMFYKNPLLRLLFDALNSGFIAVLPFFLLFCEKYWLKVWWFEIFAILLQRNSGTKATLGRLAQLV